MAESKSQAKPWLRPEDIIAAVSEWTGISEYDLMTPRPFGRQSKSDRVGKSRTLLIHALRDEFSWSDVVRVMNCSEATIAYHLKKHIHPEELVFVAQAAQLIREAG